MNFLRSLCTNVAREAWRAAGTGLRRAICWRSSVVRCAESTGSAVRVSSSPGILRGSPYTNSSTDACRCSLNAMRILRRTRGRASVHCWSTWHMMAAFSVRWKSSTSLLAAGWLAELNATQPGQGLEKLRFELTSLVSGDSLWATEVGYPGGQ
jgi:hypothetical protein